MFSIAKHLEYMVSIQQLPLYDNYIKWEIILL